MTLSTSIIGSTDSWLTTTTCPLSGERYAEWAVRRGINTRGLIFPRSFNPTNKLAFAISEMVEFSKEVQKWMAQDNKNIVVIHCMGGKGKHVFLFISPFLRKLENYI